VFTLFASLAPAVGHQGGAVAGLQIGDEGPDGALGRRAE
jgi:hypothetical protein